MTTTLTHATQPLRELATRRRLHDALEAAGDLPTVAVVINGQSHSLEAEVGSAVVDLLARLARGEGVLVSSVDDLLTTGRAASLLGVSRTYVCRLMDEGTLPYEYRGTHRRIRVVDALTYLEGQRDRRRRELERVQEISRQAGLYDDSF